MPVSKHRRRPPYVIRPPPAARRPPYVIRPPPADRGPSVPVEIVPVP
ncbi:hypothetical protein PV728_08605 [Streptomyces europaeiscabiei]|nr:hypothetical protein [Streptomyces europaeiscabiei]MDX3630366.1 hypothetical protein [Streptomyces europaeiscabiei]MDX3648503.1 hypothetical protein [Streptomyces europaeiscabiei]